MTLLQWFMSMSRPYTRNLTRGQGLVEYALLLIFVAVVMIAVMTILGPGIQNIYQDIIDQLQAIY